MAYTPTEWESADVVTAVRMNALESAVGDLDMSYTPNVWSDGDILTADKMNALEQAVASGGGGGSDFSKAEVTLIPLAGSGSTFGLYDEGYSDEPWGFHCLYVNNGQIVAGSPPDVLEPTTFTIYYIGESLTLQVSTTYISSTGDVTYNSEDGTVTITGDCSITGYVS